MQEFVDAGAPPEIMYMAHPHIGTFKLVKVVEHMRETIQRLGGEIHFGHRVDDIIVTPDGVGLAGPASRRVTHRRRLANRRSGVARRWRQSRRRYPHWRCVRCASTGSCHL